MSHDIPSDSSTETEGERQPTPRPFSAGFWDADTNTTAIRRKYFVALTLGCLITAVAMLSILSIYWGAFWTLEDHIHNLKGWVVDFDVGAMGQVVKQAAMNSTGAKNQISWSVIPASKFANGPSDVVKAVFDEKCWVAIVVNPDASARLDSAVSSVNTSYYGSSAATIYAIEARNENSYQLIISPLSQAVMNVAIASFAPSHARQLASNPNISLLLSTAPNLVTQPLGFTLNNLRPFDVPVASATDFVGMIYLVIISFITTNIHLVARMTSGMDRHLRLRSLVGLRLVAPILMYFFLSLIYALINLAFQIPFDRKFGHGGFVLFWMLCWLAMCALGLTLEAMITLLTQKFVPFFLILLIIVDVSVSYFPIELLPGVFRYGYATVFYNVNRAVRTIIFSTRNEVGLNFGVLFVWIAISLFTLPLFQWYRRRETVRTLNTRQSPEKTS